MSNALFVAWRSGTPTDGRWGPVGRLEYDAGTYRFFYTRGAMVLAGFRPFPEMPQVDAAYEAEALFPLFANRLLAPSRPEDQEFLAWGGFDPDNPPDPISVLGVTEGRRATDSLEVFPCPAPDASGCYINKFFLHGVRYMPSAALERIDQLRSGEMLGLMPDLLNPHDPRAVAVRTCDARDRFLIGYVPRYLAREVWDLIADCDPQSITLTVERVNRDAPLEQRALCRMSACWPESFQPCSRDEFQPVVGELSPMRP